MMPVETFCRLGRALEALRPDDEAVRQAAAENPWFTPETVCRAARALAQQMLTRDRLEKWMALYPALPVPVPRRVRIVMAGNIPMVGFFDLLCVLMAGHRAEVKYSGKDSVMMRWIADRLKAWDPSLNIEETEAEIDAVIATGGESANRHFRAQYAALPALLRGSRQSVAVLCGAESDEELRGLSDDIFAYSGLGCRNVSLLFVPHGYDVRLTVPSLCEPYRNNYRQQRALCRLAGRAAVDLGGALLLEQRCFPTALSTISVARYDRLSEVGDWLAAHDGELQCVVSRCIEHGRRVDFGQAQSPALTDYPDAADVMKFLAEL